MLRWFALLGIFALLAGCAPQPRAPLRDYSAQPPAATASQPQPAAPQVAIAPADTDTAIAPEPPATQPPQSLKPGTQRAAAPAAAAASGTATAQPPRAAPYRKEVADYVKRYAVDPNSLQQGKIGTPFDGTINGQSGSIVCVELQGKQDYGRTAYLLRDNRVVDSQMNAPLCKNQHLDPW